MSSVDSALSATSEVGRDPVVVLVTARTATERRLVGSWARQHHPGARLVDHDDPALGECLQDAADPIVVPARVTWLPPDRDGRRTFTAAADLIALASPRQPPAILQRRIADRSPDRARVTVGESARALALHVDFDAETGGGGGNRAFAAFVVRRAMLACDRTERRLIGERYKVPRLVAEQITASARFPRSRRGARQAAAAPVRRGSRGGERRPRGTGGGPEPAGVTRSGRRWRRCIAEPGMSTRTSRRSSACGS